MHGTFVELAPASTRRAAEFRSEKSRGVRRRKFFSVMAKHAFPNKTAPELRALTGYPERTIYDWLSGKSDAPWSVYVALFGEISQS